MALGAGAGRFGAAAAAEGLEVAWASGAEEGSLGDGEEGGGALRDWVGVLMSRPTASRRRSFCSPAVPVVGWSRDWRADFTSLAAGGGRVSMVFSR